MKIERGRAVVHDSDIDKMLGLVDDVCDGINVCGPTCGAEWWWGTLQNKQKSKIKHVQNKTKTCNIITVFITIRRRKNIKKKKNQKSLCQGKGTDSRTPPGKSVVFTVF